MKFASVLLILSLAISPLMGDSISPESVGVLWAGTTFDISTTLVGRSVGLKEANPLMKNSAVFVATKVGVSLLFTFIGPNWLRWTVGIAWIGVGVWNVIQIQKRKRYGY